MAASLESSSSQSTSLSGSNKSTVSVSATVTINVGSFNGASYQSYGRININGTQYTITGPTKMAALSDPLVAPHQWSFSKSVDILHNTDGSRGAVACSASFDVDNASFHNCSSDTADQPALDYVRLPTTPGFSSGPTRSIATATMNLSGVTNYGSSLNYYVDFSQNGGGYTGQKNSTSTYFSFPNLSLGSSYVFRAYAGDSEGTSGTSTSGTLTVPNVPSAPSTCTVSTPAGRSVTVTSGSAINNGATITGYYAQQSADNGVTWKNAAGTVGGADLMTSQQITYSNLFGGATYKFRVYAANEMGSGATTTSASTFVPSGGKRYDGTSFVNASTASRRNETNTEWVPMTITKKYVDGAWTDFV